MGEVRKPIAVIKTNNTTSALLKESQCLYENCLNRCLLFGHTEGHGHYVCLLVTSFKYICNAIQSEPFKASENTPRINVLRSHKRNNTYDH